MRAGALLLVGLVMAACAGPPGGTGAGSADTTGTEGAMAEGLAASVEVKVQGGSVVLVLHVTNDGDRPIHFTFPTSQRFDFVVETAAGEPVWRWSEDMMFAQALTEATLAPGETWEFDAEWAPGNRSGRFQVVAEVTASEHDVRQRMTFELP